MSKTHFQDNQDDIDAELDAYIQNKKVTPVVASADQGIDLFGSPSQKKKPFLQRLLASLKRLLHPNRHQISQR